MRVMLFDDLGSHFAMEDYHVIIHGVHRMTKPLLITVYRSSCKRYSLGRQNNYGLRMLRRKTENIISVFPCKEGHDGIFQYRGSGQCTHPPGPFIPQPEPIKNSFSIDPAVFKDDDGEALLYVFRRASGVVSYKDGEMAFSTENNRNSPFAFLTGSTVNRRLCAKVVERLSDDLLEFG